MKNHLTRIFIFIFAFNILALGYYIYFRNLIFNPERPTYISDHPMVLLSGRTDQFRAQGCWVLRYAGQDCHFCEGAFVRNWLTLENVLDKNGCKSYELSPNGFDLVLDGDTNPRTMILAISSNFAQQLQFYRTPMTIAGFNHKIIWRHAGPISKINIRHCLQITLKASRE